jgi:hypothetical protein
MKLFLYLLRWQTSSAILYPCVKFIPLDSLWTVIINNLVGGLIFYPIDKLIFKKRGKIIESNR